MDVRAIIDSLGVPSIEVARLLDVSDGHVADLKSGRRALSLKLAAKLEALTGREGIVDQVVKSRVAA